jgi:hypothetical protein
MIDRDELFRLRMKWGYSWPGIAKATGYGRRTIARWEGGHTAIPRSAQVILHVMAHSGAGLALIERITGCKPSAWLAARNARLERGDKPAARVRPRGRPVGSKNRPAARGEGTRAGG